MRPAEVARRGADYLDRHGVDSPLPAAELLLARILRTDRAGLYARSTGLSTAEARTFGRALCRRCAGTPLQHLTGEQGFRRLSVGVAPGVYVPRPETEVLVEAALEEIAGSDAPLVIDVGTGTGAIALAIVDEHPGARVWATDVSEAAVALAAANAERAGLTIRVAEGDLLSPLPEDLRESVDLVVSNPPYLRTDDRGSLPVEVLADPPEALFAGLDIYRRLAEAAGGWLRTGGALAVEIGERDTDAVVGRIRGAGFRDITVRPDLTGRHRVVTARWA